ncbi:Mov34/MPN/PAD-1 family protein [Acinetobacter sp.]|uniref:C40 family peptidase n=1 Tax=Acinetobacter sp. TaxID=472 RepID=UPI002487DD3D|nr:Mov34/MPN/PAD-1 family protein [Acinetobacter sp.]MDI1223013.1 NlpC/P60 family protein [Acinetobacter sp.]
MKLSAKLKKAIHLHAAEMFPDECCGVIVNDEYIACRNVAPTIYDKLGKVKQDKTTNFEIHPQDLANAEDSGVIQAYVHSHPNGTTRASELDLHQVELHKKPWVICACPDLDFAVYEPCGFKFPLIGRNYHHGWMDCYTIVRDFYSRELGINIPDFERLDRWWESAENASLYLDNFGKAGFFEVSDLQYGDVMLCRVNPTKHVNHAVIWLGDNGALKSEQSEACVGSSLILHHPYNCKSVREVFGQQWQEQVAITVRHRNVKNN